MTEAGSSKRQTVDDISHQNAIKKVKSSALPKKDVKGKGRARSESLDSSDDQSGSEMSSPDVFYESDSPDADADRSNDDRWVKTPPRHMHEHST